MAFLITAPLFFFVQVNVWFLVCTSMFCVYIPSISLNYSTKLYSIPLKIQKSIYSHLTGIWRNQFSREASPLYYYFSVGSYLQHPLSFLIPLSPPPSLRRKCARWIINVPSILIKTPSINIYYCSIEKTNNPWYTY